MIDQAMGGDLVYIVSKNALFAGPNNVAYGASKADQAHQVRLLAAELGAVRDPGQRRQPGRRRPRVRDLRQGLGRRPGADLRDPRGQARRVLRPADAAQAGGPAGARRRGRVRPDRRRPQPDDGSPHPGRRGCRGGLPAVTGRLVAAVDLGASSGRVMVGRVAPNELELTEVHRFPNEPVRLPDGLHWDVLRLYREVLAGLREAARAADGLVSVGRRLVGRRLRPARRATARCSAIRSTTATSGTAAGGRGRPRRHPAGRAVRADRAPVPARSTRSTSSRPRADAASFGAARTMLLIPDLIGYWLSGVRVAEVTNASTTGAARRPPPDLGRRS